MKNEKVIKAVNGYFVLLILLLLIGVQIGTILATDNPVSFVLMLPISYVELNLR